jgi:predicted transcriptional regulator
MLCLIVLLSKNSIYPREFSKTKTDPEENYFWIPRKDVTEFLKMIERNPDIDDCYFSKTQKQKFENSCKILQVKDCILAIILYSKIKS